MSKILILANMDIGLYKFRKELIQELLKNNKVWISLPYGDLVEPLKDMGCKFIDTGIERRGMNPIKDFKLLRKYLSIMKEIKPDLVITYTIKPNIYGGIASRCCKIPYYTNITGLGTAFQKKGIMRSVVKVMYRIACKRAKRVFFENRDNCRVLMENKIITKSQAVILPGAGINLEEYPLFEYPDTKTGYRFLFVGRIMQEKGIDELFEVAEKIHQERKDVFFDIVGPYEDDYKKTTERLEERGIINFYGYQEDVKPFLRKCHCFVLPSWHEGMANTLLEAASTGRPIITSDIYGCKEAVEERRNGLLCSVKDSNSLYNVVKEFLELSDEQKEQWGQNSRKRMELVFDKKIVVSKTIQAITN